MLKPIILFPSPLHSLSSISSPKPTFHLFSSLSQNPSTNPQQSAIELISNKLKSLGITTSPSKPTSQTTQTTPTSTPPSVGEIFLPNPREIPNNRVGHTLDKSWGKGEEGKERERSGSENEEEKSLAERSLRKGEMRRLITIGIRMREKLKIGKSGVSEGVVNGIHERWRSFEVVKIVCEDVWRLNMSRTHLLLERKTGGMVVWRSGGKIILYRGPNYKYPYFSLGEASANRYQNMIISDDSSQIKEESVFSQEAHVEGSSGPSSSGSLGQSSLVQGVGSPGRVRFLTAGEKQLVEEAERLLDGLGPRFTGWWGCDPLPIDGDLLPAVAPGYRRPFRLLPFGVRSILTNDERTILKRLGSPLPCHFALGRNRNLQGVAAAMLKLWEKCEIAKVALKRGVQSSSSLMIAKELKSLTGGILLSRDNQYIVFYRGKDFLPSAVSLAIEERRNSRALGDKQLVNVSPPMKPEDSLADTGGGSSTDECGLSQITEESEVFEEQKKKSIEALIVKTSNKLSQALEEKAKAEKVLSELEEAQVSQQADVKRERITEEEKYMLKKVALKMKPFLLLGKRGVFDGTVENMHLHWKYRELVKIICGGRKIDEIRSTARMLEAESGGILVGVERVSDGHAIIIYRGKNYQRPASLRPQTLLNKKQALKRSIEAQRNKSLKLHVLKLAGNIEDLKLKLVEEKEVLNTMTHLSKSQMGQDQKTEDRTLSDKFIDSQGSCQLSAEQGQKEKLVNITSSDAITPETSDECSFGSINLESSQNIDLKEKTEKNYDDSKSSSNAPKSVINSESGATSEHRTFVHEATVSAKESDYNHSIPSFNTASEDNSRTATARPRPLTNKERVILRRQALKMKKRPLIAIGNSNVIAGVAKTIKDHFKRYPLAIVNVKGRAKESSGQEFVVELEKATGGVLVSREINKIILYRGWGAEVETGRITDTKEACNKKAGLRTLRVSPELVEAMRLECGLSSS